MTYFPVHAHSNTSVLDGMSTVDRMVNKVKMLGQPALALTDHGNMGNVVKAYRACKKAGIKFFPGFEGYLIDPQYEDWENPAKGDKIGRYHFGIIALNEDGYIGLVKLCSLSHTRPRFNRFPRLTLGDLVDFADTYGDDVAVTTGCYFGWLTQTLVNEGMDQAQRVLKTISSIFPHTFVEIQNHHITHEDTSSIFQRDDQIADALFRMAKHFDLPVVAGQDSHYTDQSEKKAHALMKRMTYGGVEDEFPGDSFHLASTEWVEEHFTPDQWAAINEGHDLLLALHDVSITPLDTFQIDLPRLSWVRKPQKELESAARGALTAYLDTRGVRDRERYERVLDYELDVIKTLRMAKYIHIVKDVVEWCRDEGICVETRGSGNASLVLLLLGVTQADPVEWHLDFDRFISKDRIKPPDVDLDVEDSERMRVVNYLLSKYGGVQICTWGKLGSSFDPETGEEKGSVLVSWLSSKRRECEDIAAKRVEKVGDRKAYAQAVFNNKYGDVKEISDVGKHSQQDLRGLHKLASMNSAYRSYGVHPGGVLLPGANVSIEDYIPTMLVASSNTRVSQYDMHDVEQFGILKLDVLGQSVLRTMRVCQELMGLDDPTDFTWMPNDDKEATKLLRDGRVNTGIFHFEGFTKSKGGRELGVKSTKDAVLVQALYMPGCMDVAPGNSISQKDLYLLRRNSADERRRITYLHPVFEQVLKETYGAVVFQEQVINIMRNLGMDIAGINTFFAVVKNSGKGAQAANEKALMEVRQQFDDICKKNGITDTDAAWSSTAAFVAYGFNRAHATGYGLRSYRTAYLKAHNMTQYMTALLRTWSGTKKEAVYIREARRLGIRLLPPDVNVSDELWTLDGKVIRKGLLSVPGIGAPTAAKIAAKRPFTSMEDLIERVEPRALTGGKKYLEDGKFIGILAKLNDVGALDSLIEGD